VPKKKGAVRVKIHRGSLRMSRDASTCARRGCVDYSEVQVCRFAWTMTMVEEIICGVDQDGGSTFVPGC
jgi:hypothetical protein